MNIYLNIYEKNFKECGISAIPLLLFRPQRHPSLTIIHQKVFSTLRSVISTFFFCSQDMQFSRNYDKEPIVMIAPNHNSEGNNLKPIYMSVTAWIEVLSVAIDIVLIIIRLQNPWYKYINRTNSSLPASSPIWVSTRPNGRACSQATQTHNPVISSKEGLGCQK